ncbi:YkoP family protein [Aneurinibacillus terranovensis]|uniref:YkoP family protein n=1 Tax=Aneurinibacillus terranovensis TaxID=278991 RepID=UPI0005598685
MFTKIWSLLDWLYFYCSNLSYVNRQEKNIFRVKLITYRGKSLCLSNGAFIHPNDVLLKIHLHNSLLMKEMVNIKNDIKRAFYVYSRVETSLPGLAVFISRHPKKDIIRGVIGITLLSRGVSRLGFEVKDITNPYYKKLKQLYMKPMFILCYLDKKKFWKNKNLIPKILVLSKEQLLNKYL